MPDSRPFSRTRAPTGSRPGTCASSPGPGTGPWRKPCSRGATPSRANDSWRVKVRATAGRAGARPTVASRRLARGPGEAHLAVALAEAIAEAAGRQDAERRETGRVLVAED